MDKILQVEEYAPTKINHFGHRVRWLILPLEGVPMDKINISGLYDLGASMSPLTEIDKTATYRSIHQHLVNARGFVTILLQHQILPLAVAQNSFRLFGQAVNEAIEHINSETYDSPLDPKDYIQLTKFAQTAASVLSAELQTADVYFVAEVNGYNTQTLIEHGEKILGETLANSLPEKVKVDLCEATKALAFRLHTAVGFHMLRAVEAVIMEYLTILKIPHPTKPIERNLGNYIALLKKGGVDNKITLPLDLLRKEHRNELMHPDRILEQDESLNLFEVCKGALMTLLTDMNVRIVAAAPVASAVAVKKT